MHFPSISQTWPAIPPTLMSAVPCPPQAKLDVLRIPLRPSEAELAPLCAPRDTLPEGRVTHRLLLTYKLTLAEGGKVTPTLPLLNRCEGGRTAGCCADGSSSSSSSSSSNFKCGCVFNTPFASLCMSSAFLCFCCCLPAGMCTMASSRPRCSCSLTATSSAWQVGGH